MTVPPDEVQEKAHWLTARRGAITATDAGAILGVSKYASQLDIYLDKIGELPEVEQTEWMDAGNRMQRPIIDWWAERAGVVVRHERPFTFTRRPGSILGASLDATVVDTLEPVDAKNIGWKKAEWGDGGTDKIPLGYAVQLAVQMHVVGASRAFLPVLFGGHELVCYEVARDLDLEAAIVERCETFWRDHVEQREPPPVDGTAAWSDYLKRTFTQRSEVVVRATAELNDIAHQLNAANDALKRADIEADRLKNQLKLAIGEHYALEGPSFRATWGTTKDTLGTDYEQAAKDLALELATVTGKPATKLLADAAAKNQSITKKGFRRLTFTFKGS